MKPTMLKPGSRCQCLVSGVGGFRELLVVIPILLIVSGCAGSTTSTPSPTLAGSSSGITSYLYYYLLDGEPKYTIVYSISNYTQETLKVDRAELLDGTGDVKRTISESSIQASSSGGLIEMNGSFKLANQVSKLPGDIKDWVVRWYCTDSSGQSLIIEGKYSIPRN